MNKLEYIAPQTSIYAFRTQHLLMSSTLDKSADAQDVTTTDDNYNGEFTSRRRGSQWDDDDDDF